MPADETTPERPELAVMRDEEAGTVRLFEPEGLDAYIVADEHDLLHLGECA
jgi:hypothetical protein